MSAAEPLGLRQLNRATLARQGLLARSATPAGEMIARLAGLQAQDPSAPFVGLWSRIAGFERAELDRLLDDGEVVKVTWVRGTLHLVGRRDYAAWRSVLQPMLSAGWAAITRRRPLTVDLAALLDAARGFFAEEPRTFAELSSWLEDRHPVADVGTMRYAVRTHLPLRQLPVAKGWRFPARPQFLLAEDLLGDPPPPPSLDSLVLRYLGAFGPASVQDAETWFGGKGLAEAFAALSPHLRCFRVGRREVFDVAEGPLPDADTDAPVRFLPPFDNLLLSHRQRQRVVADEHRSRVFLPGLRVAPTILVDGFVAGNWRCEAKRGDALLVVEPFQRLAPQQCTELEKEGESLLELLEPTASSRAVRIGAGD